MERPIHILFSGHRERYGDLLERLQQRYAVHQAHDIWAAVEYADQARAAGRPYDLALIAYDLPLFGEAGAFQQFQVIAPTTPLLALVPPDMAARPDLPVGPEHLLVEPIDPEAALAQVGDLLEERAEHVARLRSEVVAPLAALNDEVLRQPDLLSALRALYRHLAGLVPADLVQIALYDRRRAQVMLPLVWERGVLRSGRPHRHQPQAGLSDWVIAHDAAIVSGDLRTDAARRGWPPGEPDCPQMISSALVLPLRLGGEVLGAIGVFSGVAQAFTQADFQIVNFVADFMAGVAGHWWGRRRREREHAVLAALDAQLQDAPDRATVLAETAQAALQLTGMAAATVIGLDPTGAPVEEVVVPHDTTFAAFTPALAALAQHLTAVRQTGEVDYSLTTRTLTELGERGLGRVISYTLTNDGQADALLWLLHGSERAFDDEDKDSLGAVARQGRMALATQAREQARAREQQGLAWLAWRASVESSPTLLLSTAFNEIRKLVPWQGAALWQADPALGMLRLLRIEGALTVLPTQPLPLDEALLAKALAGGGVQRLGPDLLTEPEMVVQGPALAVALPRSPAQGTGALVLERTPGAPDFSPDEENLLLSLVQLLAAGLERLRWQRLGALHHALSTALATPLPALWAQAVGVVAMCLGEDTTAGLLPAGSEWRPLAVVAPDGDASPPPWAVAGPLLQAALAPGAAAQVYSGAAVDLLGSLAVAPLALGGPPLGVLVVWTARLHAYGAAELELLAQAADRLAPLILMGLAQAGPGPAA